MLNADSSQLLKAGGPSWCWQFLLKHSLMKKNSVLTEKLYVHLKKKKRKKIKQCYAMKNNSPSHPRPQSFSSMEILQVLHTLQKGFVHIQMCLSMYYAHALCVHMFIYRCTDLLFKMRLLYASLVCVNCSVVSDSLRPCGL